MARSTNEGLVREIRRWDLIAFVMNGIVGAGIFGLPSQIYGLAGSASLLAFLGCAAVVALIIACFAEVGSRFSRTGGPYLYSCEAFGPIAGFQVGWMIWLARLTSFAANCNLLVQYLGFFWNGANSGAGRAVTIVVVVAGLTLINLVGVRDAALVGDVFAIGKLIPLVLFVGIGLFFVSTARFASPIQPGYGGFSTSVLLMVYAFTGFEVAVIPAGEESSPRRDLPMALAAGLGTVTVLYTLIQVVCIGTLPELATSTRPLADASRHFLGGIGAAAISFGALISIVGNLSAITLAAPRVLFAMAEQDQLPRVLAATHKRFRTPHVAILVSGIASLAFTLSGTFIQALTISTIARLISYAATCAALPVLRRKEGLQPALFRAPAGVVTAAAALVLIVWLLSNSTWNEARATALVAAIGFLVYAVYRAYASRRKH
jgi:amino acid transporter